MSGRIRTGSARVTLSNLTPAHKSQHSVGMSYFLSLQHPLSFPLARKNVLAEVKAQVMEEQLDEVTMVKNRDLETGSRRLDLRVGRLQ